MILILLGNISLIYARVGLFPYQEQHLMGKRRIHIMKRGTYRNLMFGMIDLMKNKEDLIDERKFKRFANPF